MDVAFIMLSMALSIAALFIFASSFDSYGIDDEARPKRRFVSYCFVTVSVFLMFWYIIAYNQEWTIKSKTQLDVETYTFPDGRKIQNAVLEDGNTLNCQKTFGCIIPENAKVFKTVRNGWYCGVYFADSSTPIYTVEFNK